MKTIECSAKVNTIYVKRANLDGIKKTTGAKSATTHDRVFTLETTEIARVYTGTRPCASMSIQKFRAVK
jgi:hypothetical protein